MKSVFMTLAGLSPAAAMAHSGGHAGSMMDVVVHFMSQPDHWLGMLAVTAVSIALVHTVVKQTR